MSHARIDWRWMVATILVVILFVPMRRYVFPVNLPFELEPYRVLVALVIVLWALSLLAQPDVALRRSGLEGPVLLYALALLASDFSNPDRMVQYQSLVVRGLTLALSFVIVFYFVVSVVRTFSQVLTVVKLLVSCTTVLAVLAMIESRTGWSPFEQVHQYFPLLHQVVAFSDETRGATFRAVGSAEHPIALGALLAIVAPLALYLAVRFGRWWWVSLVLLMGGTLATNSRTAVVMLLVASLVTLALRFRETWRFAPLLLPMVVLVHFAVPGALGSVKASFAPSGGLIKEHSNDEYQSGRLADVGPSFELFREKPVFGYGYGTLQTSGPDANSRILDNQWLSSLLNVGLVGALSLVWLFARFIRRVGHRARNEETEAGWLLVALVASVAAFAVGMLTFDAFAFTQVTFVFFVLLALGSALVLTPDPALAPRSEPAATPGVRQRPARSGPRPALSAE